jgi:hypothetical protein
MLRNDIFIIKMLFFTVVTVNHMQILENFLNMQIQPHFYCYNGNLNNMFFTH